MQKPCRPIRLPERNSVMLVAALGFLAGCRLAVYLHTGLWLLAVAALCAPLGWLLRRAGRHAAPALFLCALALGVYSAGRALSPAAPPEGRYAVAGYVRGEVKARTDDRYTFTLCDISLDGETVPGLAYCSLFADEDAPALFDGAALTFPGRVYHPDGKSGETHFDFRLWMYQNGIAYGVTVTNAKELQVNNTPDTAPVMDAAYRVRAACGAALERTMGDKARVAMAMLFSDRDGLSDDESKAFQRLGVAHILSVSGLHVGILGALLMRLLTRLGLRRGWQLPVVGAFLLGYCALTGFSAAAQRAAITLTLVMLGRLMGRRSDSLATLAAAMLAVLVLNPLQAYSAGFALSFSAVASILLLYPALHSALMRLGARGDRPPKPSRLNTGTRERMRRVARRLVKALGHPAELLALSLAAQLGVAALTAVYFNQLPLYGVLVNLLIVPLTAVLVPLFALALLVSPVPLLGGLTGAAASFLSDGLLWLVGLMSRLPYASVRVPTAPAVVLIAVALCLLALSRRLRGGAVRRAVCAALCVAIGLAGAYAARPPDFRYIQLAVGQADAALILDGDRTVAIDAGADGTAMADYLLAENRDLDALYITHLHFDHAGGALQLLEHGIRVKQVYLPVNAERQRVDQKTADVLQALRDAGAPVAELAAGDEQRYNLSVLRALWPVRENVRAGQDANELPLVLAAEFGGYTLLCASDLTGDYERYAAMPCDVLKVAHHGSGDSTLDAFLDATSPSLALISCSSGSRSLPSADTLERLTLRGVPYARTDVTGDITLTLQNGRLIATGYKARIGE